MENNSIDRSKMSTTVATEGEGVSVADEESADHQQQQHVSDDDDCADSEKSSGHSDDDPSVFYFESDHLALKGGYLPKIQFFFYQWCFSTQII